MKVLIACEESQRVCSAFRARGHEAYSCDIIDPSGGHPEWHIKGDVLRVLNPIKHMIGCPNYPEEERVKFASGKSMPAWYTAAANLPPKERSRIRSQTFPGFAEAMAEQWGV